jgi:hypothetical protein
MEYSSRRRSITASMSGNIATCSRAIAAPPSRTPSHTGGTTATAGTSIAALISRVLGQP